MPFSLALLLTIGSSLWRIQAAPQSQLEPTVTALPQDPYVQVFFNQSEASVYTDPYRQIERYGDDLEQVIINAIESAQTSIDIAVQDLNLPRIAQAVVNSHRQGITVRLILENQYANPTSAKAKAEQAEDWLAIADSDRNGTITTTERQNADALGMIRNAQVPLLDDTADGSKGSGLMHHKFLIIDQRWVVTGSANLTMSGIHGDADVPESRGNANALLKLDSRAIARHFTNEFNLMWGDGPDGQKDSQFGLKKARRLAHTTTLPTGAITLQFSPHSPSQPWQQSVNGLISKTLSQATRNIDLALFVFSEQRIANQLEATVSTGTTLRALIDPSFAYRSYSEALDMLGMALPDQRCKIESNNRPWAIPLPSVGSPQLPPGDKLHHKFATIDDQTVIVGSHNWSHAANSENDETILIIQNPTVAAHFHREFERLYRTPNLGQTKLLKRKINESKQRCTVAFGNKQQH